MLLSIIIVNYHTASFLGKNLASIQNYLRAVPHEVIIVDNASGDGSVAWIQEHHPEVRLVVNPKNLGFAAAINEGLKNAQGDYILWLNPDSELLDPNLGLVLQYMEGHPEVGIVGPKILNPDQSVQLSCRSFPSHGTALFNRYSLLTRLFPANPFSRKYLKSDWHHGEIQTVDWVSGACLLHRRSLIEDIGMLDESFFMYCEDVDFCLRAHKKEWQTVYHPGAAVLHHIGGSSRHAARRMILERHKSMWRYYLKHYKRNFLLDAVTWSGIFFRGLCLTILGPGKNA